VNDVTDLLSAGVLNNQLFIDIIERKVRIIRITI